jgi:hypothetical protein
MERRFLACSTVQHSQVVKHYKLKTILSVVSIYLIHGRTEVKKQGTSQCVSSPVLTAQ